MVQLCLTLFSTSLFKGFADFHLNGHIHMRSIYDRDGFVYSNPGSLFKGF